jgi:hypothetical protein
MVDPTEARHVRDTATARAMSVALALTGTVAVVALSCAGRLGWQERLALAVVAMTAAAGWLIHGGRVGYDIGARMPCTGALRLAHLIARGNHLLIRPDGPALRSECAADEAALAGLISKEATP